MSKIIIESPARFAFRSDTGANWTANDPVLLSGEIGVETDGSETEKIKIGDGVTRWTQLSYWKGEKGDKGDTGDPGEDAVTDQTYNAQSANAQSGVAVAQAVAGKENTLNKVTALSFFSTDTQYPSAKCVYDHVNGALRHPVWLVNQSGYVGGEWTDFSFNVGGSYTMASLYRNGIYNFNEQYLPAENDYAITKDGGLYQITSITSGSSSASTEFTFVAELSAMSTTAITQALAEKENISNKVTAISAQSTDTQYPSAKCVYDLFDSIVNGDGVSY